MGIVVGMPFRGKEGKLGPSAKAGPTTTTILTFTSVKPAAVANKDSQGDTAVIAVPRRGACGAVAYG